MALLEDCSVGVYLNQQSECHKTTYSRKTGLLNLQDLPTETLKLLKNRTGIGQLSTSDTMCLHHEKIFLHRYEHLQVKCCDPFVRHKGNVTKGLRVIDLEKAEMMTKKFGKKTVAGWKLCVRCVTAVNAELATAMEVPHVNDRSTEDEGNDQDDDEVLLPEASTAALNESLGAIGVSPPKISKLNRAQHLACGKRKLLQATSTLQSVMVSSLSADTKDFQAVEQSKECQSCKEFDFLIEDLEESAVYAPIRTSHIFCLAY